MRCPKCGGSKSSVIDSRQAEDGNTIRRRRECDECQYRFTTYERVEERTLVVVKKDGIIRSAQKRPVSSDEIEAIVSRIEQKVRSSNENEIASEYIGGLVMEELAELDEITYVRFASVYRSFKDVSELESLLKQITKSAKKKKEQ